MLAWLIPPLGIILAVLAFIWFSKYGIEVEAVVIILLITVVCEFLFGFNLLGRLLDFDFPRTWDCLGNCTFGNETWGNWTFEANETIKMPPKGY